MTEVHSIPVDQYLRETFYDIGGLCSLESLNTRPLLHYISNHCECDLLTAALLWL